MCAFRISGGYITLKGKGLRGVVNIIFRYFDQKFTLFFSLSLNIYIFTILLKFSKKQNKTGNKNKKNLIMKVPFLTLKKLILGVELSRIKMYEE